MEVRDSISTHLPLAVVASVVISLFNLYTGEMAALIPLLTDFVLHIVAIFAGFVIFDGLWNAAFDESGS